MKQVNALHSVKCSPFLRNIIFFKEFLYQLAAFLIPFDWRSAKFNVSGSRPLGIFRPFGILCVKCSRKAAT